MKEQNIKAVKFPPNEAPSCVCLVNELPSLQAAVGIGSPQEHNCIEVVWLKDDCVILCNEEGRLLGLPGNRYIEGHLLVGTVYIIGHTGDEFASLSDDQCKYYMEKYAKPDVISDAEVQDIPSFSFSPISDISQLFK